MDNIPMLLELLVDGELDETRRAKLIRSLDSEPDGWKHCALLFLEDQALRSSLTDGFPYGRDPRDAAEHRRDDRNDDDDDFPFAPSVESRPSPAGFTPEDTQRGPEGLRPDISDAPRRSRLLDAAFDSSVSFALPKNAVLTTPQRIDPPESTGRRTVLSGERVFRKSVSFQGITFVVAGLIFGLVLGAGAFPTLQRVFPEVFPNDGNLLAGRPDDPSSVGTPVSQEHPVPPQTMRHPTMQVPHEWKSASPNHLYASYCEHLKTCPFPPDTRFQTETTVPPVPYQDGALRKTSSAPRARLVSLKTEGRAAEHFVVPCFDNRSLDPEQIRTRTDRLTKKTLDRLKTDGCHVKVRRQYYILKGGENELILIPAEDTIIRYAVHEHLGEL